MSGAGCNAYGDSNRNGDGEGNCDPAQCQSQSSGPGPRSTSFWLTKKQAKSRRNVFPKPLQQARLVCVCACVYECVCVYVFMSELLLQVYTDNETQI